MKDHLLQHIIVIISIVVGITGSSFQSLSNDQKKIQLEQDTCLAASLIIESEFLIDNGVYLKASQQLESARLLFKKHKLWERYIDITIQLAHISDHIDFETKAEYANEAVHEARANLPKNHLLKGLAYQYLAETKAAFEQYDSSLFYYEKAITILEVSQRWEAIAWCKLQQAINYFYLGDNKTSKDILSQSFWREHHFEYDVLATLYNFQGVLYYQDDDIEQSIKVTEKALSLDLANPNKTVTDSYYIANHFNNLGSFYNSKRDYQRAIDYHQKAAAYYNALKDIKERVINTTTLGKMWVNLKDYERALYYLNASEELITSSDAPESYAKSLSEVYYQKAVIYRDIKHFNKALDYAKLSIKLDNDLNKGFNLITIGSIYLKLKQPALAIKTLGQALEAIPDNHTYAKTNIPRIYQYLGDTYAYQQQYKEALKNYNKALTVNKAISQAEEDYFALPTLSKIYDPIYFLEALQAKARVLSKITEQPKGIKTSLETYQLAIQLIDSLRQDYILEENEIFWGPRYKEIYEEAIHTAYQLYEQENDGQYLEEAFLLSERSKAHLFLEAFKTNTGTVSTGVPSELIDKEKALKINTAFFEQSLYKAEEANDSSKIQLYQEYLTNTRLELAQLKETIERDYPRFYDLKYGDKAITIAEIRAHLLDEETVIIQFFTGALNNYAFLLTQDHLDVHILPDLTQLDAQITSFNQSLFDVNLFLNTPHEAFQEYNKISFEVFQSTLSQAVQTLPDGIKNLILIPDGSLSTLPFEVLTTQLVEEPSNDFRQLSYLLNRFNIQYNYSINLLFQNQKHHQQLASNSRCLAFAPAYQQDQAIAQNDLRASQARNGISPLLHTSTEINGIKKYFKGRFDTSAAATKDQFLQNADQYGLLHLAMHGEADFENAKFGHLIFSNIKSDNPQGHLLYNYEIANQNLKAQLAVLSACETGVGKYEAGEGVFSIARSFMYAGVPGIIMSLWKVNDQSTSQIMPLFYKNLSKGERKDEALRKAKLEYLNNAALEFRHPFYWSGFVALGTPAPLNRPYPSSILLILGGGALLLLAWGIWWFIVTDKTNNTKLFKI